MSEITPTAAFSFTGHKVKKFTLTVPDIEPENVAVDFDPSGEYDANTGIYKLILVFSARYGEKNENVFANITAEGYFRLDGKPSFEDVAPYFYANSIAILFPYLRAFVTVLTSVGNIKPLILPTLNLGSLAIPLKENTVVK